MFLCEVETRRDTKNGSIATFSWPLWPKGFIQWIPIRFLATIVRTSTAAEWLPNKKIKTASWGFCGPEDPHPNVIVNFLPLCWGVRDCLVLEKRGPSVDLVSSRNSSREDILSFKCANYVAAIQQMCVWHRIFAGSNFEISTFCLMWEWQSPHFGFWNSEGTELKCESWIAVREKGYGKN